jgi:hypothetical protein
MTIASTGAAAVLAVVAHENLGPGHLDAVVVEYRPAHVGVALVDGGVDRGAVAGVAGPAALGAGDDAGTDAIGDVGDREECAARVADANLVAGGVISYRAPLAP